jgi:GntR family transcriptional regulator/MocR family aminotransferase
MGQSHARHSLQQTVKYSGEPIALLEGPEVAGMSRATQVYKTCLEAILDGRLWRGARLPSARELAGEWGIARNTIDEALMQLQADGFLERRVGDGTYVAQQLPARFGSQEPRKMRAASRAGQMALETFSAWAQSAVSSHVPQAAPRPRAFMGGFPALDAFPLAQWQRIHARRMRSEGSALLTYFPTMGYGPLREAVARHLSSGRGVVCSPDQVMILTSSIQGLDLIARVLAERGDEVWMEESGYPNVRVSLSMSGVKPVGVPVDDEGLDVAAGRARARNATLVHVSPACSYATGAQLSLRRRLALLQWAESAGAWIVEDDYQGEFTHEGRPLETLYSLDRGARVLHLGTFTNSMFPSLRLSYMVIPPAMCAVFEAVRSQLDDHTHGISQAVLADFIEEGHFAAHLRRMRPIYRERREALLEACERYLPRATVGAAVAGMNVALHLPRSIPDRSLRDRGGAAGLALMPLSRYAPGLNGLHLGFTALAPAAIREGARRLAALIAA